MSPEYKMIINLRVAEGYIEAGRFNIGNDLAAASKLAGQLQGDREPAANVMLRLDFIAHQEELISVLRTIGCTLEEMSENIKLILKEIFRLQNLEA
jgi:hypothetical protein